MKNKQINEVLHVIDLCKRTYARILCHIHIRYPINIWIHGSWTVEQKVFFYYAFKNGIEDNIVTSNVCRRFLRNSFTCIFLRECELEIPLCLCNLACPWYMTFENFSTQWDLFWITDWKNYNFIEVHCVNSYNMIYRWF